MGSSNSTKYFIMVLFLGMLVGTTLFGTSSQNSEEIGGRDEINAIEPKASTNPSSPTYLSDDSVDSESYSSSYSYYYRTSTAYSSYYHVVWVQPYYSDDNFNLYLYSDSSYSNLLASSTRGDGLLDWVVFHPSSTQFYYPRVYCYDSGSAYIEWEDSSTTISVGNSRSVYLSSSEYIEIYEVYLSNSKEYDFTLELPGGLDFDLYLYYLSYGDACSYVSYQRRSVRSGSGLDEKIDDYSPYYDGDYAIIVVRRSGSGSATLKFSYAHDYRALIITIVALFVISGILSMAVAVYKKYNRANIQGRAGQGARRASTRQQTGTRVQPRQNARVLPQRVPQEIRVQPIQNNRPIPQISLPINRVEEIVRCPYCNHSNQKDDLFCRNCGSELW